METRLTLAATLSFAVLIFGAVLASTTLVWADPAATPHTTIVVNGTEKLPPGEWDAFVSALRANLRSAENAVVGIDENPTILPDSEVVVGLEMDDPLVIFLHGSCTPRLDGGPRFEGGRLGWVDDEDGSIEPFIHIECDNIVRMLEPVFFHLNRQAQINAMGEAMARATLHEWVHVKRQVPSHDKTGIEKAHYSLRDLIPDFCAPVPARPEACFPDEYGGSF
ncbi:MAG: hypothetical protein KGN79_12605 [Acidobacteriota bacterium]|nr:hypothetical protein [Acidobacteriota bacterium]